MRFSRFFVVMVASLTLPLVLAGSSSAQTFTTLSWFPGFDQFGVFSPLVQGVDGDYYGTALDDSGGYGNVYKITPAGLVTILHSFCSLPNCADGSEPEGSPLVLGTDGNLYGVTYFGGASCTLYGSAGCGTVFEMTPSGTLTVLHTFSGPDGSAPTGLIQDSGGNFYGTTSEGGAESGDGCGTIFKITPHGALTTLHSFGFTDGCYPVGLIQATNGKLYGATLGGGPSNIPLCENYGFEYSCGTVFNITTGGTFTLVDTLSNATGAYPLVPMVQASNGNFYGTAFLFQYGNGDIYRLNSNGTLKAVYWWKGADDFGGTTGLVQASDGNLYGTGGGYSSSCGSVFKLNLTDEYTPVYQGCGGGELFENNTLMQGTNGMFYGSYTDGSASAIYSLDAGLSPFVAFVQPSTKVNQTAEILGQGLTGATIVTFNGVAATKFTVVSDTFMTAVVPSGATTGPVVVTTPGGALTSNVSFRIIN